MQPPLSQHSARVSFTLPLIVVMLIGNLLPAIAFSVFGYLFFALAIAPMFGFSVPLGGTISSMQPVWNCLMVLLAVDGVFVAMTLTAVKRNGILFYADHLVLRKGVWGTFGRKVSHWPIAYTDILRVRTRTWRLVHPLHTAEVRFLVKRKDGSFERITIDNIERPAELKKFIADKREEYHAASDGVTDRDFMR